jgi:hypothetical protein
LNTGESYISEGGKYILESTKVIDKDDKAGWFKDKAKDTWFRVLQKDAQGQMMAFEKVKNRKQALQFFGASVVLPGG